MFQTGLRWLSLLMVVGHGAAVVAFDHIGNGIASTWASNHIVGTPAVVTWGFMPDGTIADPALRLDPVNFPNKTGLVGGSNITSLRNRIDQTQGHGAGAFDAALQRAMATWSAVANITFVGPVNDPGLPFASNNALTPDIRIGAFNAEPGIWFQFAAASGFGPPGFGPNPLSGDIIFNLAQSFNIQTGTIVEDVTPLTPFTNELEGLMLHELGHAAIGLAHPVWDGATPDQRVMYTGDFGNPLAPPCCQTINHQLHPDDVAGAQFVYGVRGDFNSDGTADAADFTAWRDNLGGQYTSQDYAYWNANFGDVRPTSESSVASVLNVPEASGALLFGFGAIMLGRSVSILLRCR